jgi:hypothetical protein
MSLVLLESAKDRVLAVETPEQLVSPYVGYGMTCLLIRGVVGSVLLSCVGRVPRLPEGRKMQEGSWYRILP